MSVLGDIRPRFRIMLGSPSATDVPDATLDTYIDLGHKDVATRFRFHNVRKRCTFPSVIGTDKYTLPTDLAIILTVRDTTNFFKLRKMGARGIADLRQQTNSFARRYVRFRNYIQFVPPPGGVYVYEIFYVANPVTLSAIAPNDVLLTPPTWDSGVLLKAKWHWYLDKGDDPKMQSAWNMFKLWASDKPNELDEEAADIDSAIELPELSGGYGSRTYDHRFDDGTFDYREGW
jgi:hypothetical protein